MRLSLGIYDVFAYAIPGSLYLALGVYVADRLNWFDVKTLEPTPTLFVATAIVVTSYLLGHVTTIFGALIDRALWFWRPTFEAAREDFFTNVPEAATHPHSTSHPPILLTAIESQDKEAAQEINRLRATGLMVRNCITPLLTAAAIATAEAITTTDHKALATTCAATLTAAALTAFPESRKLRYWAHLKTLESCFWLPTLQPPEQPQPETTP
ncbi:hypothetical protein [Actinomadura flavalba]|uniref:hypothetical protein n=1 Tax=Actinomadura flavalba TaxID=1120938 RepID=UPI0003749542|nr:hypothetical protein [Actinomadura flavalba]